MRSRYSAYCCKNIDYIFQTYHPDQHRHNAKNQIAEFANAVHFVGLTITKQNEDEPALADNARTVSFVAHYINGNKLESLVETSRFILGERWYYYDGDIGTTTTVNVGRNDRCPCGSGKKFKQCIVHLNSGARTRPEQ
tara:strand:- start:577 stop:990 length:414 start_codon:yes stop_codon:yes gene_type:complete